MAFIALLFAGGAVLLFLLGICGIILSIVLKTINSKRAKRGIEKSRALSVIKNLSLVVSILALVPLTFIAGFIAINSISEAHWQKDSLEYNVYEGNIDRARTLLEKGADPNAYKSYIYPPLYFSLENDDYDMAKMLLKYGANPDAIGKWDRQLLNYAVYKTNLDFVKLFVENGADINFISDTRTPLDEAYLTKKAIPSNEIDEIINYLIENGAKTRQEIEK